MRGVLLDDARNCIALEIFDRVAVLSQDGIFQIIMGMCYLSHRKINSVAVDETPYRRNLPGHGFGAVT